MAKGQGAKQPLTDSGEVANGQAPCHSQPVARSRRERDAIPTLAQEVFRDRETLLLPAEHCTKLSRLRRFLQVSAPIEKVSPKPCTWRPSESRKPRSQRARADPRLGRIRPSRKPCKPSSSESRQREGQRPHEPRRVAAVICSPRRSARCSSQLGEVASADLPEGFRRPRRPAPKTPANPAVGRPTPGRSARAGRLREERSR